MKNEGLKCVGNCRICESLGQCPEDHVFCEDCGKELEPDEVNEIEVEEVEKGRYYTRMTAVCPDCFRAYYQGDESIEFE